VKAVLWTAYGPPEVLQLGERPTPEPKRGQVRIRMHATAVTYSDTFARALAVKPFFRFVARVILGFRRPKRWPVLGIVVAGEIDRIGPGVAAFRQGDQVFGMNPFGAGAYAEYLCMKAGKLLVTKPANLTYQEAAAIPYGGLLALHFLRAAGIAPGMRVLIQALRVQPAPPRCSSRSTPAPTWRAFAAPGISTWYAHSAPMR
jgi:NADPH:quinone reductase-like Zn-dependent oxidoreductase